MGIVIGFLNRLCRLLQGDFLVLPEIVQNHQLRQREHLGPLILRLCDKTHEVLVFHRTAKGQPDGVGRAGVLRVGFALGEHTLEHDVHALPGTLHILQVLKGHGNQLVPGNGLVGDDVAFVDVPRKAPRVLNHDLCGVVLDVDRCHILIGAVRQCIQQSLLKNRFRKIVHLKPEQPHLHIGQAVIGADALGQLIQNRDHRLLHIHAVVVFRLRFIAVMEVDHLCLRQQPGNGSRLAHKQQPCHRYTHFVLVHADQVQVVQKGGICQIRQGRACIPNPQFLFQAVHFQQVNVAFGCALHDLCRKIRVIGRGVHIVCRVVRLRHVPQPSVIDAAGGGNMRIGFFYRYHQHHTVRGFYRLDFGKQAGPGHIVDGFHQCLRVAFRAARNGAIILHAKQQNAALCICQRNRTFHRKVFPLPVVLALHPRLKLLPGAFPGSNHFAECLFGHDWDLPSFLLCFSASSKYC